MERKREIGRKRKKIRMNLEPRKFEILFKSNNRMIDW